MTDGPPGGDADSEIERLRAGSALEADHRRAFDQAQREADALFAQYQLSQLIASGGSPAELGRAVLVELVRLSGAARARSGSGETGPTDSACSPPAAPDDATPDGLDDVADGRDACRDRPDLQLVVLGEEPPATSSPRVPDAGGLDADGLRVAQLARHELAVAFGGAPAAGGAGARTARARVPSSTARPT